MQREPRLRRRQARAGEFAPRDVVSPYEKKKDPKTGVKTYRDAAGALHLLAAELRALEGFAIYAGIWQTASTLLPSGSKTKAP